jgi:DNA-binding response OmpR family regulator
MRILVAEDEHRIAQSIQKGLVLEMMTVDVVYDGMTAYERAAEGTYDVIILDLMLPEKNGIEVCRELRQDGVHTPIIMLTAKGQVEDRVAGLQAGADDYVTKPFSFEELLARVRAVARRPHALSSHLLRVADLELDTERFTVTRQQQPILLSQKEFRLLEYFIRHAHQIISKDQLIAHVWDYDSDILPNTVEVYIRNLRRKIDQPFAKETPLLQTIRGFGYRLGGARIA